MVLLTWGWGNGDEWSGEAVLTEGLEWGWGGAVVLVVWGLGGGDVWSEREGVGLAFETTGGITSLGDVFNGSSASIIILHTTSFSIISVPMPSSSLPRRASDCM